MSKLLNFISRRLALQLAMVLGIALIFAYLCFYGISSLGYNILIRKMDDPATTIEKNIQLYDSLDSYIEDKAITPDTITQTKKWADENKCYLTVLSGKHLLYDSMYSTDSENSSSDDYTSSSDLADSYTLYLRDGSAVQVVFYYYGYYSYYNLVNIFGLLLGFLLFLCISLGFIHLKLRYIRRMALDLDILAGGDLTYSVTQQGNDELCQLAYGMNQMRLSILEKQHRESENRRSNQELVTALSHDIRTPLTSLIGYIEILQLGMCKDPSQQDHYLDMAKEKAYLIRDLSDKLFEYFIVSEKTKDSYRMEKIETAQLIDSLLDNQLFDLTSAGFQIEHNLDPSKLSGTCMIDLEFIQRVMNNILSNIKKYADPALPICVEAEETEDSFSLSVTNYYLADTHHAESTGIGIRTCRKIMLEHQGECRTIVGKDTFSIRLAFPLLSP